MHWFAKGHADRPVWSTMLQNFGVWGLWCYGENHKWLEQTLRLIIQWCFHGVAVLCVYWPTVTSSLEGLTKQIDTENVKMRGGVQQEGLGHDCQDREKHKTKLPPSWLTQRPPPKNIEISERESWKASGQNCIYLCMICNRTLKLASSSEEVPII